MTEQEWLTCKKMGLMFRWVRYRASDRKLRLFGCACCRHVGHRLPDVRSRRCVEVSEQFADGQSSVDELRAARQEANISAYDVQVLAWQAQMEPDPNTLTLLTASRLIAVVRMTGAGESAFEIARALPKELKAFRGLLRDIFGNPFRRFPPRLQAIAPLAEEIYAGAWDNMPLVGEWLQDHGHWREANIAWTQPSSMPRAAEPWNG
jgi:hypothetical protein